MIGRIKEIEELNRLYESDESEFVAVYGRRRVGKTYLVRGTFSDRFATFAGVTGTRKAIHLTLVTANGLLRNQYSGRVQSEVVLADLFT